MLVGNQYWKEVRNAYVHALWGGAPKEACIREGIMVIIVDIRQIERENEWRRLFMPLKPWKRRQRRWGVQETPAWYRATPRLRPKVVLRGAAKTGKKSTRDFEGGLMRVSIDRFRRLNIYLSRSVQSVTVVKHGKSASERV